MRTAPLRFALLLSPALLSAQLPPDLARDRADYAAWLTSSPVSPLAAVARQPIGAGIRLGPPDADLPLAEIPEHRLTEPDGTARLEAASDRRIVPRGVPVRLGPYTLTVDGPGGRGVVTVFAPKRATKRPAYYDYQPALVFSGGLRPPERPGTLRVLGPDGLEVEAAEAGTVVVPVGGKRVRLRVLRLPTAGGEESELEIFFRDGTNGRGSYPAGRFVRLEPGSDGRYRLDFNRARNPFCAYSTAYSCPAPWRGNAIAAPVPAGERYGE